MCSHKIAGQLESKNIFCSSNNDTFARVFFSYLYLPVTLTVKLAILDFIPTGLPHYNVIFGVH